MYHPYSGAASYIYANERPYAPADAHHNGPYEKMQSFIPIESIESLPSSNPYSPQNTMTWTNDTWTTDNTFRQSQFSEEDQPHVRVRRDSQRPLLPLRVPVPHPYSQQLSDSWFDDESVAETPVEAKPQAVAAVNSRVKRMVTMKEAAPLRRSEFVPYEQRPSEGREREQERERGREKTRLAAAWRRKIQKRVKRALRRLRRYLEGL